MQTERPSRINALARPAGEIPVKFVHTRHAARISARNRCAQRPFARFTPLPLATSRASCVITTAEPASPLVGVRPVADEHHALVGPDLRGGALLADVAHEADRVGEFLAAELDDDTLGPGVQLLDIGLAAHSDLMNTIFQEVLDLRRQRPEPVDELGGEGVDLLGRIEVGEAPVERQPQLQVGHVAFRNHDRRTDGDLRRPAAIRHFAGAADFGDRASSSICW